MSRDLHPDTDDLVDRFAEALKDKLAKAERKYGYQDGWRDPSWRDALLAKLREHVGKGDPRDVAAYCAFAWHHGWSISEAAGDDLRTVIDEIVSLTAPDQGQSLTDAERRLFGLASKAQALAKSSSPRGEGTEAVAWRYRNVAGGWTISDRPLPGIPECEPLFAHPAGAEAPSVVGALADAVATLRGMEGIDRGEREAINTVLAALSPQALGESLGALRASPSVPTERAWPLVVALCESLHDDHPDEPISDSGGTVLDGWRDLARRILPPAPSTPTAGDE